MHTCTHALTTQHTHVRFLTYNNNPNHNMHARRTRTLHHTTQTTTLTTQHTNAHPHALCAQPSHLPPFVNRIPHPNPASTPCSRVPSVPAVLTITDIAGLVAGAADGAGLGNAFLSHIQAVDGLFHVRAAMGQGRGVVLEVLPVCVWVVGGGGGGCRWGR